MCRKTPKVGETFVCSREGPGTGKMEVMEIAAKPGDAAWFPPDEGRTAFLRVSYMRTSPFNGERERRERYWWCGKCCRRVREIEI